MVFVDEQKRRHVQFKNGEIHKYLPTSWHKMKLLKMGVGPKNVWNDMVREYPEMQQCVTSENLSNARTLFLFGSSQHLTHDQKVGKPNTQGSLTNSKKVRACKD